MTIDSNSQEDSNLLSHMSYEEQCSWLAAKLHDTVTEAFNGIDLSTPDTEEEKKEIEKLRNQLYED